MRAAVRAYHEFHADHIVAEVNAGGDYLHAVLKNVDAYVPYKVVRASRGKQLRAEPIAALYEQRRIHHVGMLPDLEQQMCEWIPGISGKSPDRLDACVYALSALNGLSGGGWGEAYGAVRCAECDMMFILSVNPKVCPTCKTEHGLEV